MKRFILPQAVLDVVKFTVTPTGARVVTLDGFTAPCSGMVDWGDGTASPLTSTAALSHTYADATARQIAVRGVVGGFWNTSGSTGKNLVTSLDEISSESLVTLQNTFRGCTALRSLPDALRIPNVANFNYTFYQNRSIISNLTPLWLTHTAKPHSGCFTDCCKSLYGQHGGGCPYRQYVSAVPQQTYFQKYGQNGCPSATYYPATSYQTYLQYYGWINTCPNKTTQTGSTFKYTCSRGSTCSCGGDTHATCQCGMNKRCNIVYSNAYPAYYSCSHFGGTCKTSSCTRIYQSGQSAYYRCTRSGGTCQTTSCPYPYANEISYNNARNNGWA